MINYFYINNDGFITLRGTCAIEQDIPESVGDTLVYGYAPNEYNYYKDNVFIYEKTEEEYLYEALSKRLVLLQQSDFTQLTDVPITNREEWSVYRQELRDITDQEGWPKDVIWPTKPA